MITLESEVPDVDMLVSLSPEDLAPVVLRVARTQEQNGSFHPDSIITPLLHPGGSRVPGPVYAGQRSGEVEAAVEEALQWLQTNGLVIGLGGGNRNSGYLRITRRALPLLNDAAFRSFKEAVAFPRTLLHPVVASKAWAALARGDLGEAVFSAFKAVEEAVRDAAGFGPTDIGVKMMRAAFGEKGRLTDPSQPKAEQEALEHLFAGAIGSYKNPHSHRTVTIAEPREAQEMVLLASHLLRIVDARRP